MDQRRQPRFETDQPVEVFLFGDGPAVVRGRVKDVSGRGLGLVLEQNIPPGSAVRLSLNDALVLGEVAYSRAGTDGWFVGVELQCALYNLDELHRLASEILGDSSGYGQRAEGAEDRDESPIAGMGRGPSIPRRTFIRR